MNGSKTATFAAHSDSRGANINRDTYSTAAHGSFADRAAYNTRLKIYKKLSRIIDLDNMNSIVDVGVTADKAQIASNFFENLYPFPERVTAFSDQDASWMEGVYKGLKFKRGTALDMPFEDNEFDLVFSSAVIEHVGAYQNQEKFIRECFRVAKRYVFITTPNRLHPIEFHTAIPFMHWLPKNVHRKILKRIGKGFFAREENLNLLTRGELRRLCDGCGISEYRVPTVSFLGFPSNLLLIIEKRI